MKTREQKLADIKREWIEFNKLRKEQFGDDDYANMDPSRKDSKGKSAPGIKMRNDDYWEE